jgi:1-phosphofructokinase family hexose kinase
MIYTVTLNPAVDKELVVSELAYDTVLRSQQINVDYGGKGFNVSRILKAMGTDSVALGFAGGNNGKLLSAGLTALGIDTDFVWVDGETRTNVSIVTAVPSHYVKVNEPGPTISDEALTAFRQKVKDLAAPDDWWVLAGSLPPGVPATIYADMIEDIQAAGAYVILDTSGEALKYGCAKRPFLAKPNDAEAHNLTGMPVNTTAEIAAAAKAIQATGVTTVVVSLGKAGALVVDGEQVWQVESPVIKESNPIGAGDSMVGGLVWGLSSGLPITESVAWGIACGAATASLPGTTVGNKPLIDSLHPQVNLHKLVI